MITDSAQGDAVLGLDSLGLPSTAIARTVISSDSRPVTTDMMNEATDRVRRDWERQADGWYEAREALMMASPHS